MDNLPTFICVHKIESVVDLMQCMSVKLFNPLLFLLVIVTDKHCHAHPHKSVGFIFQWYLAPEEQASEMSCYDLSGGLTAKTVISATLFHNTRQ